MMRVKEYWVSAVWGCGVYLLLIFLPDISPFQMKMDHCGLSGRWQVPA